MQGNPSSLRDGENNIESRDVKKVELTRLMIGWIQWEKKGKT